MLNIKLIERKNSIYFNFVISRRQKGVNSLFSDLYTKDVNPFYSKHKLLIPPTQSFYSFPSDFTKKTFFQLSRKNPRIFETFSNKLSSDFFQAKSQKKFFSNESLTRARQKILNLALHNCGRELKFLTLTFNSENLPKNFRDGLLKAQNAMKRLQYYLDKMSGFNRDERHTLKYCLIPELGEKNKRLHFHAIAIFPFIATNIFASEIWKMGFCQIKTIRANENTKLVKAVAGYVAKYISKNCEMLEGRTRIYYASHTWKSDCRKAYFTKEQAFSAFKVLEKMQNNGEINPPRITFFNFDNSEIEPPSNDFVLHFWKNYPNEKPSIADIIKIELDLPKPKANIFLSFLHSINVDFYKSDFMRKSKYEERYKAECKAVVSAYEKIMYDFDSLQSLTSDLAFLFKNIDRTYIQSVLEDVYYNGGENQLFNNLPLINRHRDLFDLENQTCNKYLKRAAVQKIADTIDRRERFELMCKRRVLTEIAETALQSFFRLNSKKIAFDRQRRKEIERRKFQNASSYQKAIVEKIVERA